MCNIVSFVIFITRDCQSHYYVGFFSFGCFVSFLWPYMELFERHATFLLELFINSVDLLSLYFIRYRHLTSIMWDVEIRGMASAHAIIASSIFMATVMPAVFVENFSVYGTHMVWLYCVAGSVAVVNIAVFGLLGISPPTKKNTLSYKVEMGKMFSNDKQK